MYWLDEDMKWRQTQTDMPNERFDHCMVQINDCEIALIGGETSGGSSDSIDIYNFKTNTWREGPT
jgi:hypothetical protein